MHCKLCLQSGVGTGTLLPQHCSPFAMRLASISSMLAIRSVAKVTHCNLELCTLLLRSFAFFLLGMWPSLHSTLGMSFCRANKLTPAEIHQESALVPVLPHSSTVLVMRASHDGFHRGSKQERHPRHSQLQKIPASSDLLLYLHLKPLWTTQMADVYIHSQF